MNGDENGNLRLNDTITRAEVSKMLCVAGNIDANVSIDEVDFPDVSKNHWAYKYVMSAKQKGIINGDDTGKFRPDDSVTYDEVIKMVVSLLGYEEEAQWRGGYPTGYLETANTYGITKGIKFNTKSAAVREDVGLIILNALDIPLMIDIGQGNNKNYVKLDGSGGKNKITLRDKIPEYQLVDPMIRGFVTLENTTGAYVKIGSKLYERGFRTSSIEIYKYNNELYTLYSATTNGYINNYDSLNYLIALCTGFYKIFEVENPYLDGKIELSYNPNFGVVREKTYVSINEYIETISCKKGNLKLDIPEVNQAEFNNNGVKFVKDIYGRWYVNLNEFMKYFKIGVTVSVGSEEDISYIEIKNK